MVPLLNGPYGKVPLFPNPWLVELFSIGLKAYDHLEEGATPIFHFLIGDNHFNISPARVDMICSGCYTLDLSR